MPGEKEADEHREAIRVRTFLIADMRGYTRFSQEHGDEAASRLATRFANIVREAVPGGGGELLELRGDEALCVFSSAREALGAALDLQRRFRNRVDGEPALPLGVGVGLDAGEAVPTDGGYRGRALNVASRLCALASPGEILASETVATLAGRHEEATYARRRPARLKGVEEPVRHVEVVPDIALPPLPEIPRKGRRTRRVVLAATLAGVLVLSAIAAAIAVMRTGGKPNLVSPNSLAVIDPATNKVVDDIPVGDGPGSVAVGDGRVWVLNEGEQTISLVNAEARSLRKTFAVGVTPTDIALGGGRVWISDGNASAVLELNPDTAGVIRRVEVDPETDGSALAFGLNALWLLRHPASLSRIDPETGEEMAKIRLSGLTFYHVGVGEGAVWVVGCCDGNMRVNPETGAVKYLTAGGSGPIAFGFGSVWIADGPDGDSVTRIDASSHVAVPTVSCGRNALALDVAVGEGSVWVACSEGTVLRVDANSHAVIETIEVGGTPAGIAFGERAVWVSVS